MAKRGRKRAVPVSPMKQKDVRDEDPGEDRRQSLNHKEVEHRVAAIRAICAAEIDSLLSQLRLFRSYLSKEQLESPAIHFFEENLPNLSVIRNEKYKIYELKWRDTERHGDGTKVLDSLDSVAGSHAVSGFHMSVDSVRTNLFRAAELHIPDYVPDGSFEHLMLGANDSFQAPGLSSLAAEQEIYNLRKECLEKDASIKGLSAACVTRAADAKLRIKELEEIIRRKNLVIRKLKEDMVVLEQKIIQLTRERRSSTAPKLNKAKIPAMANNLLYDMSSTSPSSDSDSPSNRRVSLSRFSSKLHLQRA